MTPGLWGVMSALAWGNADFVTRFTVRKVGQVMALAAMLAVTSAALGVYIWLTGAALLWQVQGSWLLLISGAGTLVGTLLLYTGLGRGPVSIVAPIVASYPALVVALAVFLGARLTAVQWSFFVVTLAGIVTVGWAAGQFEDVGGHSRRGLRVTILVALGSAIAFAAGISAGQNAAPVFGALQTVWVSRLVALCGLLPLLALRGHRRNIPLRWWAPLTLQGLLDAGGYLALFQGSLGPGAEVAAITASGYAVVTVLLARFFLRESVGLLQWSGIALVFAGVAVLSG